MMCSTVFRFSTTLRLCAFTVFLVLALTAPVFADQAASAPSGEAPMHEPPEADPPAPGEVRFDRDYLQGYLSDTGRILTSPARWDKGDWLTAALMAGITAGLYDNEQKIKTWTRDNQSTTTTKIVRGARIVGAASLPGLGVLYLYGQAADNGKARETALLSLESLALTGVFTQALKYSFHRHRPYTGDPHNTWDGASLKGNGAYQSFPSGDASLSFAAATVIASEYNDTVLVPILAYGTASIIAMGRVYTNAHWSSDVFVGSAIGYFTAKTILASHAGGANARLSFAPLADGETAGILATYTF